MKRLISLSIIAIVAVFTAAAQTGLGINELFDGRFRSIPSSQETIIKKGDALEAYNLDLYHSLTIRGVASVADEIEPVVTRDGAKATDREVSYRDGKLYYGFYTLPAHKGIRRYIIYLNQHPAGGDKIILLYLQGDASPATVKKLLKR